MPSEMKKTCGVRVSVCVRETVATRRLKKKKESIHTRSTASTERKRERKSKLLVEKGAREISLFNPIKLCDRNKQDVRGRTAKIKRPDSAGGYEQNHPLECHLIPSHIRHIC